MEAQLSLKYDREADILYIDKRRPYPEQETEELGDDLATYGFPAATIQSAQAALDAMSQADQVQAAAIGAATQATANRDAAVKDLNAWVKQFSKIAGVALKGRPDLLKKLGL